jgi:glycosidase
MFAIVRFWLDKGVDGFRLDIINVVYKDAEFRNNPFSPRMVQAENDYAGFFQEPKFSINQPESLAFAKQLRRLCDAFGERMLLGEAVAKRDMVR